MKEDFIGYYNPTNEEIESSWNEGMFAFDANTLLNLYRYTSETSEDFLKALTTLKSRLYLPYQAAFEFLRNREGVITQMRRSYNELENTISTDHKKSLDEHIKNYKRHPLIKIDKIQALYETFLKNVHEELEVQKESHPNLNEQDYILNQVTELFKTGIGKDYSEVKLEDIFSEGEKRYAKQVPPGYKDAHDKKSRPKRELYGDLIIWKDLIKFCNENKKLIIFVTDDNKEDWWLIEKGETKRPRPELIKEFYDQTNTRILIYNPEQFLIVAKKRNLLPAVKSDTLEEIKDVRIFNEVTNSWNSVFQQYDPELIAQVSKGLRNALNHRPNPQIDIDKAEYVLKILQRYKSKLENTNSDDQTYIEEIEE